MFINVDFNECHKIWKISENVNTLGGGYLSKFIKYILTSIYVQYLIMILMNLNSGIVNIIRVKVDDHAR